MTLSRRLAALGGTVAMCAALSSPAVANASTEAAAAAEARNPCGFYETSSDAYYNHCASSGSVVIYVDIDWAWDEERCVGPGITWLGSADDINGAHYVGRTC